MNTEKQRCTGEYPLVCLPFPLTRVDNTPKADRDMFPTNSIGTDGKPVSDPDLEPGRLALEQNPNLMYEHWDEYWRKIHGPKFIHKDDEKDPSTDYVMLYNQVHRLTSGPSSLFPPPYAPMLGEDGKLSEHPSQMVPKYRRPKWDGMAHICYPSLSEVTKFFVTDKYKNKIIPDEAVFLRVALVFASAQYIIIPGNEVPDPIVMVKFYQRKDGTREDFQQKLLWDHADFVRDQADTKKYVTRYALLLNIGPHDKNDPLYQEAGQKVDAMAMMSFKNMTDCEAYLSGDDFRAIETKEDEISIREKSEWFTAINYNLVNKIGKETVTDRTLKPRD